MDWNDPHKFLDRPACPKCRSYRVMKNGSVERHGKVVQCWKCKDCGKSW